MQHGLAQHDPQGGRVRGGEPFLPFHPHLDLAFHLLVIGAHRGGHHGAGVGLGLQQPGDQLGVVFLHGAGGGFQADVELEPFRGWRRCTGATSPWPRPGVFDTIIG
jgi:hypothetical protein